jgi:hypothetical protein
MSAWRILACALLALGGCSPDTTSEEASTEAAPSQPFKRFAAATDDPPWHEPQDSADAINSPDAYSWRLFVALNWPADVTNRVADRSKEFGAEGPVVWETWANAPDVFRRDGSDPGPWSSPGTKALVGDENLRLLEDFDPMPLQQQIRLRERGLTIKFDPIAAANGGNETRMNKEAYEFIRANNLYNLGGQKALAASGKEMVQFPLNAKEIKAQWRPITEAQKPRYHWAEVRQADGSKLIFGLTALHITTKDLPNWLWTTFEHVDNPKLPGNEQWLLPSHDTFACETGPPDCNRSPKGIGLEGTRWEHYRLRGTQVDFTTPRGKPTLLANSQPEQGFQTSSSCITCHARASIAADGARLSVFNQPSGEGHVGPVDPKWFEENGKSKFTQLDFVWSMFRARPKKAP